MEQIKPVVFVITPFNEDFLALFDEFKKQFEESFDFTNAGDLDNQQNIIKDIVEGIANADVIIADLTGLNANVFYELGLAHAMNKKVIIITQDINELPFDIKSYRANQYSLQFNKLPALINELRKLLQGAIDGSVKYGNPVSDYAPDFKKLQSEKSSTYGSSDDTEEKSDDFIAEDDDDKGFFDCIADIEESSQVMTDEITAMGSELRETMQSVTNATNEMNRVKGKSGSGDAVFARNICRKLSEPIGQYAEKLKKHVNNISSYWNKIENSYLDLLDNPFVREPKNIEGLNKSIVGLHKMQNGIEQSDSQIDRFIVALQGSTGMERRLNKSINSLISELQTYLTMTDTMSSSIDRIISKSDVVIKFYSE